MNGPSADHLRASAAENIKMGDINRQFTPEELAEAMVDVGANGPIERLPGGYETMLRKW